MQVLWTPGRPVQGHAGADEHAGTMDPWYKNMGSNRNSTEKNLSRIGPAEVSNSLDPNPDSARYRTWIRIRI
jgi:hypothetical protein